MPNRLLKEGICTSDAINSLPSDSEVLFYRLLVVSDDYGRMDGRIQIVKSQCFPLKDSFTTKKIESSLDDLNKAGLITTYIVDNKPFFFINKWDQRQRSKSKYPDPMTADCAQPADDLQKDAEICGLGLGKGLGLGPGKGMGKGKGEDKENNKKKDDEFPKQDLVSDELWQALIEVRSKAKPKAAHTPLAIKLLITELKKLKDQGHDPEAVVNQSIRNGYKDVYPLKNNGSSGKTEKFDPVAYVNRNRIRDEDETDHTIIDV